MLLHLVKKDILIVKRYILIISLFFIGFSLFVAIAAPTISGALSFFYMIVLGDVILLQIISQEESKYPKAVGLLCASPYSRSTFVKAKYVFFLLLFGYCYGIHTLVMLLVNKSGLLDFTMVLIFLLFSTIVYGIYLPVEFRFGAVKARFIAAIIVLILTFGPMVFSNFLPSLMSGFSAFTGAPSAVKNSVLLGASIVFFSISMLVSIKIFSKKEL